MHTARSFQNIIRSVAANALLRAWVPRCTRFRKRDRSRASSTHTADGKHRRIGLAPSEEAYQCEAPPAQFVDPILGRTLENNSLGAVATHAVQIMGAGYRSAHVSSKQFLPISE